jgi:hypothetical protein
MQTKDELVTNIKEWVKLDTDILNLQKEMKELKLKKKQLTDNLMVTMKNNDIDCVEITGGSIMYKHNKVKKAISSKILIDVLKKYFSDTGSNVDKAEEITTYIMENRPAEVKEVLKRKIERVS